MREEGYLLFEDAVRKIAKVTGGKKRAVRRQLKRIAQNQCEIKEITERTGVFLSIDYDEQRFVIKFIEEGNKESKEGFGCWEVNRGGGGLCVTRGYDMFRRVKLTEMGIPFHLSEWEE